MLGINSAESSDVDILEMFGSTPLTMETNNDDNHQVVPSTTPELTSLPVDTENEANV